MAFVHYRIGSLENADSAAAMACLVHYRIGSLEMLTTQKIWLLWVHYRIGSLENQQTLLKKCLLSSLPHR